MCVPVKLLEEIEQGHGIFHCERHSQAISDLQLLSVLCIAWKCLKYYIQVLVKYYTFKMHIY